MLGMRIATIWNALIAANLSPLRIVVSAVDKLKSSVARVVPFPLHSIDPLRPLSAPYDDH